jgi:hypothetical protein
MRSKDAVIECKDGKLTLLNSLLLSKDAVIEAKDQLLQAKDTKNRRLHSDLARCLGESANKNQGRIIVSDWGNHRIQVLQ